MKTLHPSLIADLKAKGTALSAGHSRPEFEELVAYCTRIHNEWPFGFKIEPTGGITSAGEDSHVLRYVVPADMDDAQIQERYEDFQRMVHFFQAFVSGWFARVYVNTHPVALIDPPSEL